VKTIEASFEIVTPMFISGADDVADLRPPSIKGALRFWWRALHWGQCLQEAGDEKGAFPLLHTREADLFGAAANDKGGGQGKLLLKLKPGFKSNDFTANSTGYGTTYLLGQGLYHYRDGYLKPALAANQSFTLILLVRDDFEIEGVINSLLLWGLLGGLGSRGRKGFGSVAIKSLKITTKIKNEEKIEERAIPETKESYKQTVQSLLNQLNDALPPFTALSSKTRIDISDTGNSAENLLNKVGTQMLLYRSYGREVRGRREAAGQEAEMNFKSDHHNMSDFMQGKKIDEHPKRVIFGLPHNYRFSNGSMIDVNAVNTRMMDKESRYRRSSPLFIHIHKLKTNEFIAVQSLIPATFLPAEYQIQMENKNKKTTLPCKIDWDDIHTYLNRFKQREEIL
jgi:CRISPR-associated protein Cmr1